MLRASLLAAAALAAMPWSAIADGQIFDYGKYPDLRGQWVRYGPSGPDLKGPLVRLGPAGVYRTRFDPTKPPGAGQEAPLTPEYQAIFEANLADQAQGGQGTAQTFTTASSPGMPRATNGYSEIEFVVTPYTSSTFLVQHVDDDRSHLHRRARLATPTWSRRSWVIRSVNGSIPKVTGRYDLLAGGRDPRHFRGPRAFDVTGAPLHQDNQTIVKERMYTRQGRSEHLP